MNNLRTWICIALVWFFALLNIERFHEPINISSFVYVLAMVLSLCVLMIPPMQERTTGAIVGIALTIFVALKYALGYQIAGQMLPITITEALAIITSVGVAHKVAWSISQFENSVVELNGINFSNKTVAFDTVQEEMYREVRRAREFNRPLSVVAIDIPKVVNQSTLDQLILEVQKNTTLKQLRAQLFDLISQDLNDSDILSIREDSFFIVLTESDKSRAEKISQRLNARIRELLDCDIKCGVASFPEDEITLAGLLTRADLMLRQLKERVEVESTV